MRARAVIVTALLAASLPVHAERLPVRRYRLADGLAHEQVRVIRQDSKGYLWIGTGEGVSRFDGYQFMTFGAADGLTVPLINDIAVDPYGRVWVATNGAGIARFLDDPADRLQRQGGTPNARFAVFRISSHVHANQVNAITFADGAIWCATDNGLFRATLSRDAPPVFARVGSYEGSVHQAMKDSRGQLSFAAGNIGIVRPSADGLATVAAALPGNPRIVELGEHDGRLIAASTGGLYELTGGIADGQRAWQLVSLPLRKGEYPQTLRSDSQGTLWIGTTFGVIRYHRGQALRAALQGDEVDRFIRSIFEDRDRNIWLGTEADGLMRVGGQGIVSFTLSDGLPGADVVALASGANGAVYAGTRAHGWIEILNDQIISLPGSAAAPFGVVGKQMACEPSGSCWALASSGLYRLAQAPLRFTLSDLVHPLPQAARVVTFGGAAANGLYRDPTGEIWFATTERALYRLGAHGARPLTRLPLKTAVPMAPLARDRAGTLWLAHFGEFGRLRGSIVTIVKPDDGLDHSPRCALVDSKGRLWIGLRYGGVLVTEDPAADVPKWRRYSTQSGLASDTVWGITEDRQGRIYLATSRGLDRLDPAGGQIRHFTTENGLASELLWDILTDAQGRIWVASAAGVSRLDPTLETALQRPPDVFIRRLEIGDREVPILDSGVHRLAGIEVPAGGDRMVIQFSAVSLGRPDRIRYQYRLDGVDNAWSSPTTDRSVTYGNLGSGRYRFEVLAVDDVDGTVSVTPATAEFVVLPPIWMRWWSLTSMALAGLGVVLFTTHRRSARRRATEALRQQVATDLHDDVGSGLSEIAILSEVLHRQATSPVAEGLADIARSARNLRESMSDIVWAIGPGTDRVSDLVDRMRQAAFTMIDFEGLRVEFDAPPAEMLDRLQIPTDRRRHLLLVFKEAVTNVARHAHASQLTVRVSSANDALTVLIQDDGSGFDPETTPRGQGLNSFSRRARAMGAQLTIDSGPGRGTSVHLTVPPR